MNWNKRYKQIGYLFEQCLVFRPHKERVKFQTPYCIWLEDEIVCLSVSIITIYCFGWTFIVFWI